MCADASRQGKGLSAIVIQECNRLPDGRASGAV